MKTVSRRDPLSCEPLLWFNFWDLLPRLQRLHDEGGEHHTKSRRCRRVRRCDT
jgi:hypothetical protein